METLTVPLIYEHGLARAKTHSPALAGLYSKHLLVGDPPADEVIQALSGFDQERVHRLIGAAMEQNREAMREAPAALRDFFDDISVPPGWYRADDVCPGRRLFHKYSDLFMPAFFVVTLMNAATLISKAFHTTGRVLGGSAPQRVRRNTRHFIEIMLPGSLDRQGDGWKMSVRIRLVHAQIRRLIRETGDWDESMYGVPLSSAHMGLASANFSAGMLRQAERLGARMTGEERQGFMQIWRYASYLIGTPEDLLFEGDEEATRQFSRIAAMCEPPVSLESVAVSNALVRALPGLSGTTDPTVARRFLRNVYRISRALLGNETADQLGFPRMHTYGLLAGMRLHRRVFQSSGLVVPEKSDSRFGNHFAFLLEVSRSLGLSYRLPDHLRAQHSTPW